MNIFTDTFTLMALWGTVDICVAVSCIWYLFRAGFPAYHPAVLFQLYFLLGFGIRPITVSMDGRSELWDRIGIEIGQSEIFYAASSALIFWLAFTGVSIFLTQRLLGDRGSLSLDISSFRFIPKREQLFWILIALIAIVGTAVTIRMVAGRGANIYSFETEIDAQGKQRLVGTSGYVTMIADWVVTSIIVWAMRTGITNQVAFVTALFFLLRIYVGAQRLAFVALAIGLFVLWLIEKKRLLPDLKLSLICLAIIAVFNFIAEDRRFLEKYLFGTSAMGEGRALETIKDKNFWGNHTSHFAEADMLCAVVSVVPDPLGYNYFTQYIRILIWPIPRQIWSEKPIDTGLVNFDKLGNFYALTLSCIGDSYTNLGLFGVWIMAVVWAAGLSYVYVLVAKTGSPYMAVLFLICCCYISTAFRDGGVTFIYFILVSVFPAYLVFWLSDVPLQKRMVPYRTTQSRALSS